MKKNLLKPLSYLFFLSLSTSSLLSGNDCCEYPVFEDCCYSPDRFWINAEYLLWQIQDSPRTVPFVQNLDTGATVLGGRCINNNVRSGGRFTAGYWLRDDRAFGGEASYFFLPSRTKRASVASAPDGTPALGTPFFNVTTGTEDFGLISEPGVFTGSAVLSVSNRLQGAVAEGLMPVYRGNCGLDISLVLGFRYVNFEETLRFNVNSPFVGNTDVYYTKEQFHARNNFYGTEIGFDMDYEFGCFFLGLKGTVALGNVHKDLVISGALATNNFSATGTVETFPGGFFAQPTNIGSHSRNSFCAVPEVDFKIGYNITNCFSAYVGYTFIYLSNMIWATKQINPNINPSQSVNLTDVFPTTLVGEASPQSCLRASSLWAQGLTVGVQFDF